MAQHEGDIPVAAETLNAGVDVVIGGDGIEDEVKTGGVLLHLVGIARDDDFVGAQAERVFPFVR